MNNVYKFPKHKRIKSKLNELVSDLEHMYGGLQQGYDLMDRMETKIAEVEGEFNKNLRRYANIVGVENVELKYLEYCNNNISIDVETGELRLDIGEQENGEEN